MASQETSPLLTPFHVRSFALPPHLESEDEDNELLDWERHRDGAPSSSPLTGNPAPSPFQWPGQAFLRPYSANYSPGQPEARDRAASADKDYDSDDAEEIPYSENPSHVEKDFDQSFQDLSEEDMTFVFDEISATSSPRANSVHAPSTLHARPLAATTTAAAEIRGEENVERLEGARSLFDNAHGSVSNKHFWETVVHHGPLVQQTQHKQAPSDMAATEPAAASAAHAVSTAIATNTFASSTSVTTSTNTIASLLNAPEATSASSSATASPRLKKSLLACRTSGSSSPSISCDPLAPYSLALMLTTIRSNDDPDLQTLTPHRKFGFRPNDTLVIGRFPSSQKRKGNGIELFGQNNAYGTDGYARALNGTDDGLYRCQVMSKKHAFIFERDGKLFIQDCGSTHGTYVNNNRVEKEQVLNAEDTITFGRDTVRTERTYFALSTVVHIHKHPSISFHRTIVVSDSDSDVNAELCPPSNRSNADAIDPTIDKYEAPLSPKDDHDFDPQEYSPQSSPSFSPPFSPPEIEPIQYSHPASLNTSDVCRSLFGRSTSDEESDKEVAKSRGSNNVSGYSDDELDFGDDEAYTMDETFIQSHEGGHHDDDMVDAHGDQSSDGDEEEEDDDEGNPDYNGGRWGASPSLSDTLRMLSENRRGKRSHSNRTIICDFEADVDDEDESEGEDEHEDECESENEDEDENDGQDEPLPRKSASRVRWSDVDNVRILTNSHVSDKDDIGHKWYRVGQIDETKSSINDEGEDFKEEYDRMHNAPSSIFAPANMGGSDEDEDTDKDHKEEIFRTDNALETDENVAYVIKDLSSEQRSVKSPESASDHFRYFPQAKSEVKSAPEYIQEPIEGKVDVKAAPEFDEELAEAKTEVELTEARILHLVNKRGDVAFNDQVLKVVSEIKINNEQRELEAQMHPSHTFPNSLVGTKRTVQFAGLDDDDFESVEDLFEQADDSAMQAMTHVEHTNTESTVATIPVQQPSTLPSPPPQESRAVKRIKLVLAVAGGMVLGSVGTIALLASEARARGL